MSHVCLTIARLSSAMWVGAAFLFVATSVAEQVDADVDASTKGMLALIRFPWYYGVGATLLTIGVASACLTVRGRRTVLAAAALLIAALAVMAADYAFVYRSLVDVLTLPSDVPPARRFASLHAWSERLNSFGFVLSAAAAAMLCAARENKECD